MARVLVVDDEPNIRQMVRLALEARGYTVEEAEDGIEGLARFGDGGSWRATLLDQRMPGLEGLDVLRQMKALRPEAPVVFMTAFATLDLALDAMAAGATDFLRKPFTLDALRGAVEAAQRRPVVAALSAGTDEDGERYGRVTLNGYLIEPLREPARRRGGEVRQMVAVREPNGNVTPCEVAFPAQLVADIGRRLEGEGRPPGARFWRGLAEEMTAAYLWHNAAVPMGGLLRQRDYQPYLGPWLDAVAGRREPV